MGGGGRHGGDFYIDTAVSVKKIIKNSVVTKRKLNRPSAVLYTHMLTTGPRKPHYRRPVARIGLKRGGGPGQAPSP